MLENVGSYGKQLRRMGRRSMLDEIDDIERARNRPALKDHLE